MKKGKLVELNGVLLSLGSQETPLRLTSAKNLNILGPIVASFEESKNKKWQALVELDEQGLPKITSETKDAIKNKQLNPSQGLPYQCYVYKTDAALKELETYINKLREDEVEVKLLSEDLKKDIKVSGDKGIESMVLEEYLNSPISKIGSQELSILLETGILK